MTALVANTLNWFGLPNWFKKLNRTIEQYRIYKKTVNELNQLTDRELRDLGISRCMIHSIAMEVYTDNRSTNENLRGWV